MGSPQQHAGCLSERIWAAIASPPASPLQAASARRVAPLGIRGGSCILQCKPPTSAAAAAVVAMPVIKAASADCSVKAYGEPIAHPPTLVRCHYSRDAIGATFQAVSVVANREKAMSPQARMTSVERRLQPATAISEILTEDAVETRLEQVGSANSHVEDMVQGSADVSCASVEQSQEPLSPSGSASQQQEEELKTDRYGLRSIKEGETHMDREAKLLQRREEREKLRKRREAEKSTLGPDDLRDCTFRPVLCRDRKKRTARTSLAVSMTSRSVSPSNGKPLADRQRTALHSLRVLAADEALLRKKLAAMQAEIQERFQEADQLRAQRATLVEELEAVEAEAAVMLGKDHLQQAAKGVEFGLAKVARRSLPAGPALSQTSTASSGGETY